MFYKQNSFAGRVSPSEASAAYQPQGLGPLKDVKTGPVIEPPNMPSSSSSSSGINEIKKWQEFFQKTKQPVYLARGTRDMIVFRGASVLLGFGMVYTFYNIYLMSTGQLKKKER